MGMKSIKDIYKIGKGPSSSHTMGPFKSVRHYVNHHADACKIMVTLYGSLAATGKGHLTDKAIEDISRAIVVRQVELDKRAKETAERRAAFRAKIEAEKAADAAAAAAGEQAE